jgi:hypothetical protein
VWRVVGRNVLVKSLREKCGFEEAYGWTSDGEEMYCLGSGTDKVSCMVSGLEEVSC